MPGNLTSVMKGEARLKFQYLFILMSCFVVGAVWVTNHIRNAPLVTEVHGLHPIALFETRWLYMILLVFTGIFPFLFGFVPKPQFYRAMPQVFLANIPVTIFFILWDIWFTQHGVWGFSETYTIGMQLQGLPLEECLFFIIIPLSCTFIYWSLNTVVRQEPFSRMEPVLSVLLIIFFLVIGMWKWEHIYTSTTAFLSGFLLLYHVLFIRKEYRGRFYLAYLVTCIPFLLVNGVLTGSFTEAPVVMYHPDEIFGLRVGTVPVDDFGYSFLLLLGNISVFEWLRQRSTAH